MTDTYDMSNFLPCPFCGAKPEAMDWHAGPRARIFVDCPNGNYDDEHGGCSVGPQVVGSDMEDAAARWNRRATGPDASGLVQVLESIVEHYPHPDIDHKQFRVLTCRFARQALSEYRESTRVQHAANRDQLHQMAFEYGGDEAGQGYMVTVEEFDAILDRAMQPATVQGDPVAFARMLGGEVDWDENCLFPDAETGISDLDGRGDSDEYEIVPLYRHPPAPAAVPDSVKNALSVLGKSYYRQWRRDFEAGDRSPGYVCGDINTVLITEIVEWVRSLVNPRSRR